MDMANQGDESANGKLARLAANRKKPTQCHLWMKDRLTYNDLDYLAVVKEYVESSHFSRWLSRCSLCGQLYFREFYEVVDWDKGDDKQYATIIPVESESEADEINELNPLELILLSVPVGDG